MVTKNVVDKIDSCPECKSTYFYTRKLKGDRVCRRCGHTWKVKKNGKRK